MEDSNATAACPAPSRTASSRGMVPEKPAPSGATEKVEPPAARTAATGVELVPSVSL